MPPIYPMKDLPQSIYLLGQIKSWKKIFFFPYKTTNEMPPELPTLSC